MAKDRIVKIGAKPMDYVRFGTATFGTPGNPISKGSWTAGSMLPEVNYGENKSLRPRREPDEQRSSKPAPKKAPSPKITVQTAQRTINKPKGKK